MIQGSITHRQRSLNYEGRIVAGDDANFIVSASNPIGWSQLWIYFEAKTDSGFSLKKNSLDGGVIINSFTSSSVTATVNLDSSDTSGANLELLKQNNLCSYQLKIVVYPSLDDHTIDSGFFLVDTTFDPVETAEYPSTEAIAAQFEELSPNPSRVTLDVLAEQPIAAEGVTAQGSVLGLKIEFEPLTALTGLPQRMNLSFQGFSIVLNYFADYDRELLVAIAPNGVRYSTVFQEGVISL